MNVYLLIEDGDSFCIRARSMGEAVKTCEESYLDDREEQEGKGFSKNLETAYYHEEILQSCSLVGALKN